MSLTDDWRAGRLKTGFYYVKLLKESAVIPFLYIEHTKEWEDLHESRIEEVLAPCDYEELQDLKEENKRFREGLEDVAYCKTWFYQNDPGSLVTWALEALGAIGGLSPTEILSGKLSTKPYESRLASQNEQLHQLLKECAEYFEYLHDNTTPWDRDRDGEDIRLLTRINELVNNCEVCDV